MHANESAWEKWRAPYDPRQVDGATVTEDEHGRMVETADCGIRCPGCGICCQGYRDTVADDYQGVEEFDIVPRSEVERVRILKREVLQQYENKICDLQTEIDEELLPEIERLEYELAIVRRVKEKNGGKSNETDWQVQVDVLEMLMGTKQSRVEELRAEILHNESILAEIEQDIEVGMNDAESR